MKITPVRTRIVEAGSCKLTELINESISSIPENCVIAITSKVISLCESNIVPLKDNNKDDIIERESDYFLPKSENKYGVYLTIKNSLLVPSAGVDESNTNGYYVLWPSNPQNSANLCWDFLKSHYNLSNVGVIITDSTSSPLRWGVTGKCITYCGFKGLNNKIGESDLFGRKLRMTKVNVADALASAAVLCMGESNEQTPLAVIEDLPFVEFVQYTPTDEELNSMHIDIKDDLYGQLLEGVKWKSRYYL
jgi:putative folate metabolism gamma-glutamate ligase